MMWYFYELSHTWNRRPYVYCIKCENNTHISVYDMDHKMCHSCLMGEEVDDYSSSRWFYDNGF